VGRFPGQFLRRTELIKRSLRLDDEPKWWCREPLQFLVEQQGIPTVATPVSGSRFPDRCLVCWVNTTWISASVCRRLQQGHYDGVSSRPPQVGRERCRYAGGYIRGDPSGHRTRGIRGWIRDPFAPPPPLADLVDDKVRRVPPGAHTFLPRRHGDRTGLADQEHDLVTPLEMADLDTALSTFRESLLADVSRVIAASPAGSAQDAPRRDSPVDTRKSRSKGKTRRHRIPSPSSSSTIFLAVTDDNRRRRRPRGGQGGF